MTKTFRPYSPDQLLLLPPSLREWLPADHPVYFVNDLVATLDLEPILSSYGEERGFPPYHPVLMTKLIVYGYVRGRENPRRSPPVGEPASPWNRWRRDCRCGRGGRRTGWRPPTTLTVTLIDGTVMKSILPTSCGRSRAAQ